MFILHTNDIHGFAASGGGSIGYPKIAGFIERFRRGHSGTLALDAGDAFAGSPLAAYDKGEGILRVLNTVGLDAMCAGNADFVHGPDRLRELAGRAAFPILSANTYDGNGKLLLPPHRVLPLENGRRAAVIGLTSLGSRGTSGGIPNKDSVEAAREQVAFLRPQADVVIVLSHLGDNEGDADNSLRLAREVEGIDIIIDGHSHSVLPQGRTEKGVFIAQAGDYGRHVGVLEFRFEGARVKVRRAYLMKEDDFRDAPEKPETAAALAAVLAESEEALARTVGETAVFLDGRRDEVRVRETGAGNLVADIMREACGTEWALVIAGAVGGKIPPGPVRRGDLLTLLRVNAPLCVVEVSGADLETALEHMAKNWPALFGGFFQVSGLTFRLGPPRNGRRVSEIRANGEALLPDRKYRGAVLSFMAGGPGLGEGTIVRDDAGDLESAALAYFERHSPVCPRVEGRILTPEGF